MSWCEATTATEANRQLRPKSDRLSRSANWLFFPHRCRPSSENLTDVNGPLGRHDSAQNYEHLVLRFIVESERIDVSSGVHFLLFPPARPSADPDYLPIVTIFLERRPPTGQKKRFVYRMRFFGPLVSGNPQFIQKIKNLLRLCNLCNFKLLW